MRHIGFFARLQVDFGKAFEFLLRAEEPWTADRARRAGRSLCPPPAPVFLTLKVAVTVSPPSGQRQVAVGKGGVAQAVPEGEEHLHLGGVVIAIADVDALAVFHRGRAAGVGLGRVSCSLTGKVSASLPLGLTLPVRMSARAPAPACPPR